MYENLNEIQEDIIDTYKASFVEEYDNWKSVLESINSNIPEYLGMYSIDLEEAEVKPFTYDEFCIEFINQVEMFFGEFDELSKDGIHAIFEVIILLRIADASTSPVSAIESFLLQ